MRLYSREERREILGRLANVPSFDDPNWPSDAGQFIKEYGDLRPKTEKEAREVAPPIDESHKKAAVIATEHKRTTRRVEPLTADEAKQISDSIDRGASLDFDSFKAETEVVEYARRFRQAWEWRKPGFDYRQFNRMLEGIFIAGDPISGDRPTVRANFITGKWEPVPRNLLEQLAIELMGSRKMLHRCEREHPKCERYMVKAFSRDRYCSHTCAEFMRSKSQSDWVERHRSEVNNRRRKPQTKKRRTA